MRLAVFLSVVGATAVKYRARPARSTRLTVLMQYDI